MYAKKVRNFATQAAAATIPGTPQQLGPEAVKFVMAMVQSELVELQEARTLAEQVDALLDAIYYMLHTACEHGCNLDPLFSIVHEANMAKLRPVIKRRADGKILKPANWQPPEQKLQQELERQQREGAFEV